MDVTAEIGVLSGVMKAALVLAELVTPEVVELRCTPTFGVLANRLGAGVLMVIPAVGGFCFAESLLVTVSLLRLR